MVAGSGGAARRPDALDEERRWRPEAFSASAMTVVKDEPAMFDTRRVSVTSATRRADRPSMDSASRESITIASPLRKHPFIGVVSQPLRLLKAGEDGQRRV